MQISRILSNHSYLSDVHYFETIDSTNAQAVRACTNKSVTQGLLIIADHQTAGKGRFDHSWESNPGEDILMSLVLQPTCPIDRWPYVAFPLGIAIVDALTKYVQEPVQLKWPNDVLIGQKKCVGMLAEVYRELLILGIGINVNQSQTICDRTSLRMSGGVFLDRWEVLNDVLGAIGQQLPDILTATIDSVQWNGRAAFIGQSVSVTDQGFIEGEFLGIGSEGEALVKTTGGVVPVLTGANFRLKK